MEPELTDEERRALRRKARLVTLDALAASGGRATRKAVRAYAIERGGFTARELTAPAPPKAAQKFSRAIEQVLAWTLTDLKQDGLVANPAWSVWELTDRASVKPQPVAAPVLRTRLDELRALPYREYLRTPEWRETRGTALVRADHACALDATHTDRLEVHHRTYDRLGEERDDDVVVLCHECHQRHHEHVGRPGRRTERAPSVPPPFRADVGRAAVGETQPKRGFLARIFS